MHGTTLGVWHPTIGTWVQTVVPALMAIGGFEIVLRTIDGHGWPTALRVIIGGLLTVAGAAWFILGSSGHGP